VGTTFDVLLLSGDDFRLLTHTVCTNMSTHKIISVTLILVFQHFSTTVRIVAGLSLFFSEQCTAVTEGYEMTSVGSALGYALLVLAFGCCRKCVKICHNEIQQLFYVFSSKSVKTKIKLNVILSLNI
jgi:hypothetical protein